MKKKLWLAVLLFVLFACSNKTKSPFIEDEEGHKMYKNEDGIYVKNDWYEIDGDKYYFDMNGYMVTDSSIDGRYVGKDGKMKKNYWIEKNNKIYYLGEDGMYKHNEECEIDGKTYMFDSDGSLFRNSIITDLKTKEITLIDEKGAFITTEGIHEKHGDEYYIKKDGKAAHDEWVIIDGKDIYFGKDGKKVENNFAIAKGYVKSTESEIVKWSYIDENGNIVKNDWISYESDWCYADENGVLLQNEWKTIDGIDYYFNNDCYMVKNDFVDGVYYVDNDGKKLTNTERLINGTNYKFDSEGKSNAKITPKKINANWKIGYYDNSNEKCVLNSNYCDVSYKLVTEKFKNMPGATTLYKAMIAVDKEESCTFIEYKIINGIRTIYEKNISITISANGTIYDTSNPLVIDNGYIYLISKQENILRNLLSKDGNNITIKIEEINEEGEIRISEFSFSSTGFYEVYLSL